MSAQDGRAVELATERLWIRSLTETDWPAMKRIWADFGRSAYAAYDRPFPTADADIRALTRQFADSGLFFAVFRSDRREMIGYVCFHRIAGRYDLGYCFHSASHAHGYAGESAAALIRYLAEAHGARVFGGDGAGQRAVVQAAAAAGIFF